MFDARGLRRPLLGLLAATAVAGGGAVAVALPAAGATTPSPVTTAPTVSAYTVPGSSTTDSLAIAPVTAGTTMGQPPTTITSAPEEWILDSSTPQTVDNVPSGGPNLLEVSSIPSAPAEVEPRSIVDSLFDGVTASASDSGNSLIDVGGDAVGVTENELYEIQDPAGDAIGSEFSSNGSTVDSDAHAGVGMAEGFTNGGAYVFTSDGSRTADACATDGSGCTELALPTSWTASGVDGLTGDPDAAALFSDSNDELGELTTDGTADGPWDTGHISPLAGAIDTYYPLLVTGSGNPPSQLVGAADTWFAWAPSPDGTADELAFVADADPGAAPTVYGTAQGMPANADITALTVTPDGNILFCDAANNAIGELDVSTATITETALPSGFTLPSNDGAIEPGAASTDSAYFDADSGAVLAVGEVQGDAGAVTGTPALPGTGTSTTTTTAATTSSATTTTATTTTATTTPPSTAPTTTTTSPPLPVVSPAEFVPPPAVIRATAGVLRLAGTAAVSHTGEVALKLSCGTETCSGKLSLVLTRKERVRERVTGNGTTKLVTRSVTVICGSLRYELAKDSATTAQLKLSKTGRAALASARGRRLAVKVAVVTAAGAKATDTLTLIGAKPAPTSPRM